ncbi:MAG: phosphoribosyltransferase [archaeon]
MLKLSMHKILLKIRKKHLHPKDFDLVIGIGLSGLIPAIIFATKLKKESGIIKIEHYHCGRKPKKKHEEPKIISKPKIKLKNKRILLVDDFVKSEATINLAEKLLKEKKARKITRIALVGTRKYCLFKSKDCAVFPWSR